MNFENAIELIPNLKVTHVKIIDSDGKKVMDINGESPEAVISQLEQYKGILSSYGRLKIVGANESIFKQNWKDAYNWNVVFAQGSGINTPVTNSLGAIPSGFISANEATLMAELKALQMQRETDLKFAELNKKLEAKTGSELEKYLPMILGYMVDVDPKKLATMSALSGMMQPGNNSSNSMGLAGLQEKKTEVQTTVEEKQLIDDINDEMGKLSEKVELASIREFVKTLNQKPEFLKALLAMAQAHK